MNVSMRRVRAIFRKELREYRRNGNIVAGMLIFPVIFLIQPLVQVFVVPTSQAGAIRHEHSLLYLLAIPALVPAVLAAYSVVSEREQATLEPVLTTPVRSNEFLLGKALAALIPTVVVAYTVYGIFLASVGLFAHPQVASALLQWRQILAQVLFTPMIAAWSIWLGVAISARSTDARVAQQLGALVSLPTVAVTSLIAFNVIPASFATALGGAAVLLVLAGLGWRITSAAFDRERLITGTR